MEIWSTVNQKTINDYTILYNKESTKAITMNAKICVTPRIKYGRHVTVSQMREPRARVENQNQRSESSTGAKSQC
jgi:hypothetical protein